MLALTQCNCQSQINCPTEKDAPRGFPTQMPAQSCKLSPETRGTWGVAFFFNSLESRAEEMMMRTCMSQGREPQMSQERMSTVRMFASLWTGVSSSFDIHRKRWMRARKAIKRNKCGWREVSRGIQGVINDMESGRKEKDTTESETQEEKMMAEWWKKMKRCQMNLNYLFHTLHRWMIKHSITLSNVVLPSGCASI